MENVSPLWIDSHCHFDFQAFDRQRSRYWQQAQAHGVAGLIIPGTTLAQSTRLVDFCQHQPWWYAQGIHPYFLERSVSPERSAGLEHRTAPENTAGIDRDDELTCLGKLLQCSQPLAVGEIGLDWVLVKRSSEPERTRQQQWYYFEQQVVLAQSLKLPLILHIRGAHDEALSFLRRSGFTQGGVVHAFSGSQQQARGWLDAGFRLGIGGAMSYPRAQKLRTTIRSLPASAWLLETDAPDMSPAFFDGRFNAPVAVPLYAAILSALTQTSLEQLAMIQRETIKNTFPALKETF